MLDTLFKSLQDKGLQLSERQQIILPQLPPPKQSFYSSILSSKKNQTNPQKQHQFVISNVANQYFIVGKANAIILYKYTIDANSKPVITHLDTQNLLSNIKSFHSCPLKYAIQQPTIPIIVQFELSIQFIYIDIKTLKLIIKNQIKSQFPIVALSFISDREFLFLNKKYELFYFMINSSHKIYQKEKKPSQIQISDKQILINASFLGVINEEQDSLIKLFFVTEDFDNFERLKVKQYTRTIDNTIQIRQENFLIGTVPGTQKKILSQMNIIQVGEFFLARSLHQIIIIKKKFNKYLFMDNVSQKVYQGSNLILSKQGLICSLGKDTFELSFIKLADPKSHSRMLDSIQVKDATLMNRFNTVWTFNHLKQTWIMMVFENQGKLQIFCVQKLEPMVKLLQKVKMSIKDELTVIQQLAENLNITKKDFYLKVWASSKKELNNIHDYLLPCDDIQSIKKQLRSWLRKKKMKVCEMLKVLQKISSMLQIQLKTDLGYPLLKQYVKNQFLRRKFKLYGMNEDIDHRDLQNIYDSSILDMCVQIVNADLFPKPLAIDPLHAMAPKPKGQERNLKHVLQQFKLVLLENYPEFLINFLKNYQKDILTVLKSYYYILPKHPYFLDVVMVSQDQVLVEGISMTNDNTMNSMVNSVLGTVGTQQPSWFINIMPKHWNRELTKEKLEKSLHNHYSTSHIISVIDNLCDSNYGKEAKLQRHGLINYNHIQFKKRVETWNGVKLYLKVCEFANQCAIKHNIPSDTRELVQLFREKLKLDGVQYQQCRLYCQMHYFMLKNNIFENKKITVQGLIQLGKKPQNLVAIFFLGNRQKKQYILHQFRDLYQTPKQFNFVLQKFIFSENCSRIELEILLKQVQNLAPQFQSDNQQLIDLIIRGFCKKLQLRQQSSTDHFLPMIQQLHLKRTLALKVNQIVQLKQSADIFHHFKWSTKSYDQILLDSRTTMIKLLESYFNQEMKSSDITIEYEYFSLEFPRNMLNVLLYVKQNVFYDIDEKQVLLIYGEMLIQWKQFDVIKAIIYDENIPTKLGFEGRQFIQQLMSTTLDLIYSDESILYDDQTKMQIKNIIQLDDDQQSNFRVREQAKLAIVNIFEAWGCTVRPNDIYLVTAQWKQLNRNQFIEDLITQYIENINFQILIQIYTLLEMTDKQTKDIKIQNQQFVIFCLFYCQCQRDMGRYQQVISVLSFLKSIHEFSVHIGYQLQSQCYLQVINDKYPDDLETGRKFIDYYYEKQAHDRQMQIVFDKGLSSQCVEDYQPINYIYVDKIHYFKRAQSIDISIPANLLWNIAKNGQQLASRQNEQKLTNQQIYYNYFYLIMMTKYPDLVISRMNKISYNHDKIMNAVRRLEIEIDQNQDYWGWNVYEIYKRMLKGLYLEAIHRIPNIKAELSDKEQEPQKSKLDIIKNLLKVDKDKNGQLLKIINRCQLHLENVRTTQRHVRQRKYIDRQKKLEEEKNKIPQIVQPEEEQEPDQLNVTIKFAEIRQKKKQITSRSAFITERDIIDQVYDDLNQSKFNAGPRKSLPKFSLIGQLLVNNKKQSQETQQVVEWILTQQYDKVRNVEEPIVLEAAKNVFYDQKINISQACHRLDCLRIIDGVKHGISNLFDIFKKEISDSDLKQIFTFQFFINRIQGNPYVYDIIFEEIKPSLMNCLKDKRAEQVKSIATFIANVLDDNSIYQKKVISEALIKVSTQGFSSDNILKIREFVGFLGEDLDFFETVAGDIIACFRKNPDLNSVFKERVQAINEISNEILVLL